MEGTGQHRSGLVTVDAVETARQAIEAFNQAGFSDASELLELLHDDVVWLTAEDSIESPEYLGHDGVRRYFAMVSDAFTGFEVIQEDLLDLGDGTVVAFVRLEGTGRGSGFGFQREGVAFVFTVRADRIARFRWFEERQQALDWAREVG